MLLRVGMVGTKVHDRSTDTHKQTNKQRMTSRASSCFFLRDRPPRGETFLDIHKEKLLGCRHRNATNVWRRQPHTARRRRANGEEQTAKSKRRRANGEEQTARGERRKTELERQEKETASQPTTTTTTTHHTPHHHSHHTISGQYVCQHDSVFQEIRKLEIRN